MVGGRNIYMENKIIKQVDNYIYLGSKITSDGKSEAEIIRRIGIAKDSFLKMKNVLTNMGITISTKMRVLKCFVWSTFLYGCETWTISKKMRQRILAAEMWFLMRMLRIPWTARVTNERVLEMAGVQRETVRKRQLSFLGHLIRENSLEGQVLCGRVEGRRARGRQRIKYLDSEMRDLEGVSGVAELVVLARDRERWRSMVANVNLDTALR